MRPVVFETGSRFEGCPPICLETNLPAWDSLKLMHFWLDKHGGSSVLEWRCRFCGWWHVWTKPYTIRDRAIPQRIQKLYEQTRYDETTASAETPSGTKLKRFLAREAREKAQDVV